MDNRHSVRLRSRAARRTMEQIERRPAPTQGEGPLSRLTPRFDQLQRIMDHWTNCRRRNWNVAALAMSQRAQRLLGEIPVIANDIDRFIRRNDRVMPSHRDLVADLEQLELEFDEVRYKHGTVCVVTDPIDLGDVYLGPFEVQLPFDALADPAKVGAYRVIATEPNPSSPNDSVSHPHVQDNQLCEGEASAPIQQALQDGRICDFFILVRSVLRTYNPASAYVSLDEWFGVCCGDCGESARQGDCFYCTGCDVNRCSDCITYCPSCDDPFCADCIGQCGLCDDPICSGCSRTCPGCGESVCAGCLESCCHVDEEESDDAETCKLQPIRAAG